jgi:hypothetical protein
MNERIEKLAAQAGASRRAGVGGLVFRDSELEKFAELIVKECYVHCGGQLMDKPLAEAHGLTYNDGVMDCAIGLLQHFGVEE